MTTHTHTVPSPTPSVPPDYAAIKVRQRAAWSSGDYAVVGATVQVVAETLCAAVDLRPGQRVLDVATGSGNTALAAARCFTEVTAVDWVPALLARGRERAAAERLLVVFRDGDAESLPFADASFDAVLSTFGVMFAPDQQRAANELVRVCKPGGRIGLANWTPEGVLGESFRVIARHAPPPAGLEPAVSWGNETHLRKLFGAAAASLRCTRKQFVFRYRSFEHWLDLFRTYYGPMHKMFAALDAAGQAALAGDLRQLLTSRNTSGDATLVYPGEYLEVVVTRA
ncbi:MAG TPA: methyltransferase domain-containing protein [Planctomycetota bacterium]|nr:methyltransferase domain-containing protein [Planctomycetota bacterium]